MNLSRNRGSLEFLDTNLCLEIYFMDSIQTCTKISSYPRDPPLLGTMLSFSTSGEPGIKRAMAVPTRA